MKIAILGAGNMGTALAKVVADNGHEAALWSIETDVVAEINASHTNTKYGWITPLAGVVGATSTMANAIDGADMVILAVPSSVIGVVADQMAELIHDNHIIMTVTKGIMEGTTATVVSALEARIPLLKGRMNMMAGPAIAAEIMAELPAAVIVATYDTSVGERIQSVFQNERFRVTISRDVLGVSWCAILKNIYALSLGMCDGMSYSVNTKAALLTWAIQEMGIFIEAVGGNTKTVIGLAGIGDLVTTGFSPHGRNRKAGELICRENRCDVDAIGNTMTAEGIPGTRGAYVVAKEHGLSLPLMNSIHAVLFEKAEPCATLARAIAQLSL